MGDLALSPPRTTVPNGELTEPARCGCNAVISCGASQSLTPNTACHALESAAAAPPPCPRGFKGRGIVIPGGGRRYFSSAWVCINILRDLGCTLPIELWHLGDAEMDEEMRTLIEPLGVRCVNAHEQQLRCPMHKLGGWELKAYAMVHSQFQELIFLDADNVPVIDPTFLFESAEYRQRGAIFWPDGGRFAADDPIWKLTGIPFRDEPEVESGQAVIDKARCWKPLLLALWMNNHSDFWYQYIYGDKDTFHLAWRKLGIEYAMPAHGLHGMAYALRQHDFQGRPLFQHRYGDKFDVNCLACQDDVFVHEQACMHHLRRLRKLWTTRPDAALGGLYLNEKLQGVARLLCGSTWGCRLLDPLPPKLFRFRGALDGALRFGVDGTIECEGGSTLSYWNLHVAQLNSILVVAGEDGVVSRLICDGTSRWLGRVNCTEPVRLELVARK